MPRAAPLTAASSASGTARRSRAGWAVATLLAMLPASLSSACWTPYGDAAAPPTAAASVTRAPHAAASGDDYAVTRAVIFDGDTVGYVIDFMPVPDGIRDARDYAPGTWLVEDADFRLIGFISPNHTAYRFGADDRAVFSSMGRRDESIRKLFGRTGTPSYVDTKLGVPHG